MGSQEVRHEPRASRGTQMPSANKQRQVEDPCPPSAWAWGRATGAQEHRDKHRGKAGARQGPEHWTLEHFSLRNTGASDPGHSTAHRGQGTAHREQGGELTVVLLVSPYLHLSQLMVK